MLDPITQPPYLAGVDEDDRRSVEIRKTMIKVLLRKAFISKEDLIDLWNEVVIEDVMER